MPTADLPRDDFTRWMRELDRRIGLVEQRSAFANSGMSVPGPGVVQVDGNLNVVGSLGVHGPTTIDGTTVVSGTAGLASSNYSPGVAGWKFDGTSLEANTGVVGDGALANPITPDRIYAAATNFAAPFGSWNQVASTTVAVPAGRTRLVAIVEGYTFIRNMNTTGGSDALGGDLTYAYIGFGGQNTASVGWPLSGNGGFTGATASGVFVYTGLTPGAVLTLGLNASTGYQTIPASTYTRGDVSAGLFWLR